MILTPEQDDILAAILTKPPAMILRAGPGCAKTFTSLMAMYAISTDYAPTTNQHEVKIAYLAFNKDVVVDTEKKLLHAQFGPINKPLHYKARALTVNSLGHRLWEKHLPGGTTIRLDAAKSRHILREVQEDGRWSIAPEEFDDLLGLVAAAKSQGYLPPGSGAVCKTLATFAEICEIADVRPESHYQALIDHVLLKGIKEAFKGIIDFDDQAYMAAFFSKAQTGFDWLFVDEAQDLTPLQLYLLKRCKCPHVVLVGDPYQAIYAFRGAMSDAFKRIHETWPDAISLPLQTSFRLPKAVCELLQDHNSDLRTAKTDNGRVVILQGSYDMNDLPHQHTPPASRAILCRNNAPLFRVALACIASKVRFQMTNTAFGTGLIRDIKRACAPQVTPAGDLPTIMRDYWHRDDMTQNQQAMMLDKIDVLTIMATRCSTAAGVCFEINGLLKKINPSDSAPYVTLSTAHKAKGLEFDWVLHLDPQLIPAWFAQTPEELAQEANVAYVINSRTKHTLLFATSDQIVIPGAARRTPKPSIKQDQPL